MLKLNWSLPPRERAWFSAFVLLLVLLPLPFGANRPWASDLFGLLIGALLFAMLWAQRKAPSLTGPVPRNRLMASAIGFTFVIIWAFFQVVPWTPESWHHPLWQEAATVLGPMDGAISVDPGLFTESLLRLLGYIGCFVLAFVGCRDQENAKGLIRALALAGVFYALYGLLVQSTGGNTILWFKKWAYEGFLTSTFVNKNSYAAYAGLGLLCSFGLFWNKIKKLKPTDQILARRSKLVAYLASLNVKTAFAALPPLILLGALALTGSRAGIFSSLLGAAGLLVALAVNRRWAPKHWTSFGLVAAFLFVVFVALGGDALLFRLSEAQLDQDAGTRLAAYKLIAQAIADNPWLGFGLGTFEPAFRLYRDSSLELWFHHAHNDYLELAMDLGVPGAIIFLASLGLLVSCCLQGIWSRKRNALYPALAVAASLLLGTHAFVDFSLQIPAIAATYAALLGAGVAQSWSTRDR